MPLDAKDRERVLGRSFALDCPSLEFVRQSSTSGFNTYRGSGYLSFNEAGFFEVKLYHLQEISFEEVFESLHWKTGEIIDEKLYYRLNAVDLYGRKWESDGLLPDRNSGPGGSIIVARAAILALLEESRASLKSNYLEVVFAENMKFPPNTVVRTEKKVGDEIRSRGQDLSASQFMACNIQFEVEAHPGATVLSARSETVMFDQRAVNCIIDTFSFVTGCTEAWSIIETRHANKVETRLQASEASLRRSRIGPPIQNSGPNENVWLLFDRYLSYGLKHAQDMAHPLGGLIRSVVSSGKSSLEVEALTLSVSVESLLTSQFSDLLLDNDGMTENIQRATELVNSATGLDEKFRNRLLGAVAAMKNPRAKDFLINLQDRNLIEPTLVRVYGGLRNRSAHGVAVTWGEIQSYLNQCGSVLVLFYQLIFLKVGYRGPYTDYGTYGYPLKNFEATLA